MKTFRIQTHYEYRSPSVVNISAPTELAALDRAYELRGVISANSLGETTQAAAVIVTQDDFERTQEQPLASILAELQKLAPVLLSRQAD